METVDVNYNISVFSNIEQYHGDRKKMELK